MATFNWFDTTVTTTSTGQPPRPQDLAPGLTMRDLDSLLREHYAKGYEAGRRAAWDETMARLTRERQKAAREAESELLQWMWPNVVRRVQTCAERTAEILDSPKSTIANERKRVEPLHKLLKDALHSFHQKQPRAE